MQLELQPKKVRLNVQISSELKIKKGGRDGHGKTKI